MFFEYRVLSLFTNLQLECLLLVLNTQPKLLKQVISWCLLPHAPGCYPRSCMMNPARGCSLIVLPWIPVRGTTSFMQWCFGNIFGLEKTPWGKPELSLSLFATSASSCSGKNILRSMRDSAWMNVTKSADLCWKHCLPCTVLGGLQAYCTTSKLWGEYTLGLSQEAAFWLLSYPTRTTRTGIPQYRAPDWLNDRSEVFQVTKLLCASGRGQEKVKPAQAAISRTP